MHFLDNWHNRRQLSKTRFRGSSSFIIRGRIRVFPFGGIGTIAFGEHVVINSSVDANPVGGDCTTFVLLKDDAHIVLRDGAAVSNTILAAASEIVIGESVFLGAGSRLYDTDFHSVHLDLRKSQNIGIQVKPIAIGEGAFIGAFCTILKGVTIGEQAVIGAGSVVTANVPPRQIWAGNPARFIRDLEEPEQARSEKWLHLSD